jgi:hypothetical protein
MFEFKCDENDRVIVRIWTSEYNKAHPGEDIGHVSIEIPSLTMKNPAYDKNDPKSKKEIPFYVSLWPAEGIKLGGEGTFTPTKHTFHLDYKTDCGAEDRIPELTICLYGLKKGSIKQKFFDICAGKSIKKSLIKGDKEFQGWVLIGGNRLINHNSGESCASLAYKLLKAGGIYDSIRSGYSSQFASVVAPDNLAEAIKCAKKYELEKYPETKNFVYKGESSIADIEESKIKNCIMI